MKPEDFLPKYCLSDSSHLIHDLPRDFAYALYKAGVMNVSITNFPICGNYESVKYMSLHPASFSCDYVSIDKTETPFSWQLLEYFGLDYSGASDRKTYAQQCIHWYTFKNKNKRFPAPYYGFSDGMLKHYEDTFVFRMICAFHCIKDGKFA